MKYWSDDILGEEHGESGRQVQRYIRLNNLIPKLLQMVDNTKIKEELFKIVKENSDNIKFELVK